MALEINITPLAINLAKGNDDKTAQIVVVTGNALPIEDKHNPGSPVVIPTDSYHIPIDKKTAEQLGQALLDLAKDLKDDSGIQIANSLDGVDQAAKAAQALRG